jgi:hypothetical protein
MLPLDHLPFPCADLERAAAHWRRLGFTVSPQGAYTSPDQPEARWVCRGVFFERGWFDLQSEPQAPADIAPGPTACLFLSPDLDASRAALATERIGPLTRLERTWDVDQGRQREPFRMVMVRERVCPVPTAVIEHACPGLDIEPGWLRHPNGAVALEGLTFGGAEPGVAAARLSTVLDLSGMRYLTAERFQARFGACAGRQMALRLLVASLAAVVDALLSCDVEHQTEDAAVIVPWSAGIGCALEFVAE